MYEINDQAKTCKKKPLKADFQPLKIPDQAQFIGQFVLGSSSGPGEGLLVNSWTGDISQGGKIFGKNSAWKSLSFFYEQNWFYMKYPTGKYFATVTEFGCIPVSIVYQDKQFGWTLIRLVHNVTKNISMSRKDMEWREKVLMVWMPVCSPATSTTLLGSTTQINSTLHPSAPAWMRRWTVGRSQSTLCMCSSVNHDNTGDHKASLRWP